MKYYILNMSNGYVLTYSFQEFADAEREAIRLAYTSAGCRYAVWCGHPGNPNGRSVEGPSYGVSHVPFDTYV